MSYLKLHVTPMDTAGSLISTVFLPALAIWICCMRFICKANVIGLFESTKNIFFRGSNWLVDSLIFFGHLTNQVSKYSWPDSNRHDLLGH